MAKPEWGSKRLCSSCGAKFYDFSSEPIVCPKCETKFSASDFNKTKKTPSEPAAKPVAKPKPAPVVEDEAADELDEAVAALDDDDDDDVAIDKDDGDGLEGMITTDLDADAEDTPDALDAAEALDDVEKDDAEEDEEAQL